MLQNPEAEFSLSLRVIPSLAAPELQDGAYSKRSAQTWRFNGSLPPPIVTLPKCM